VDASGDLIKSGSMLYAGGKNVVSAIKIPYGKKMPEVSWQADIEGTVGRIISADKKLFVVTLDGKIYAFGDKNSKPKIYKSIPQNSPISEKAMAKADSILKTTAIKDGYCFVYGLKDGEIVEALAQKSELRIIAIDPDPAKVERLRKKFDITGIYGKRISVLVGDPLKFDAPPYIASLTIFESLDEKYTKDGLLFKKIYNSTRPYGGTICLPANTPAIVGWVEERNQTFKQQIQKSNSFCPDKLPKAVVRESNGFLLLVREGPLPGSDDWTHQYGDIANTVKSDDQLVKLPLGILWFGGSPNTDVLPRHGHGPPEQVIGGKLFIEGMDCISARDVYTGRVIWKKNIPKLNNYGIFYDETYKETPLDPAYNQVHIPGANARGTNFVATEDKIYVIQKESCLVLDSATGETLDEFGIVSFSDAKKIWQPQEWGYIGVYKDYLIAGAGFVNYTNSLDIDPKLTANAKAFLNYDITSSKSLVIMDRHTGLPLWTQNSSLGFRHNAIAIGADKLFCIDMPPPIASETLKRRGEKPTGTPKLMALDLQSGNIIWETTENVFGTWLSYSEKSDILIQATRKSKDMLTSEPDKGLSAFKGENGVPLWNSDVTYGGPVMLHGDRIITDRYAYNLLTGKKEMRIDPLTGESKPWEFKRNYGCNYAIASEHLLTFRSAAAGFFDLDSDGGTGNFGGFKSGCTSNLIAADGILNAPDYTRTCSCSYQNQASLAMVWTPDLEIWTDYSGEIGDGPIKSVGINFGATGDRRADNGTLWLEYPIVGGPSPNVEVAINPKDCERFIKHSSKIQQGTYLGSEIPAWVVSSGIKGVSSLNIKLSGKPANNSVQERPYNVRLFFSEPDDIKFGQRRFDVAIQGRKILEDFDVIKESGGQDRPIVREFAGVMVKDDLKIDFAPHSVQTNSKNSNEVPLICGIEITAHSVQTKK
jgi:hypothetical protein